ncbi:hypothetical protein B0J14DRAFT_683117 [Halenospora varia]|nr:hypothetical protein B0J14DRAFT_683117 [Halenospora varia]
METPKCIVCNGAALVLCLLCRSASYCSTACFEEDRPIHSLICNELSSFSISRPRPTPKTSFVLAIYLESDPNHPSLVWVECEKISKDGMISEVPNVKPLLGCFGAFTQTTREEVRGFDLDHTVQMWFPEEIENDSDQGKCEHCDHCAAKRARNQSRKGIVIMSLIATSVDEDYASSGGIYKDITAADWVVMKSHPIFLSRNEQNNPDNQDEKVQVNDERIAKLRLSNQGVKRKHELQYGDNLQTWMDGNEIRASWYAQKSTSDKIVSGQTRKGPQKRPLETLVGCIQSGVKDFFQPGKISEQEAQDQAQKALPEPPSNRAEKTIEVIFGGSLSDDKAAYKSVATQKRLSWLEERCIKSSICEHLKIPLRIYCWAGWKSLSELQNSGKRAEEEFRHYLRGMSPESLLINTATSISAPLAQPWGTVQRLSYGEHGKYRFLVHRADGKNISPHQLEALSHYCWRFSNNMISADDSFCWSRGVDRLRARKNCIEKYLCRERFESYLEQYKKDMVAEGDESWASVRSPYDE